MNPFTAANNLALQLFSLLVNPKSTKFVAIILALLMSVGLAHSQVAKGEARFSEHKWLPAYNLRKVGNTNIFQGNKKKERYFEGWYFKMVAADGRSIISIIPGIALGQNRTGDHAFIQLIDGVSAETSYYTFPIEEFSFSKKGFGVRIADNFFSMERLSLNLQAEGAKVVGNVTMANPVKYSQGKLTHKEIMGWYRRVPFMECYHGVLSLTHDLGGSLEVDGKTHDFSNGKGYIEKDWGSSMPSCWIWIQGNHFTNRETSLMLSIANVPFRGKAFNGFLGFLYHQGNVIRFASYRRSKLKLEVLDDNSVRITIHEGKKTLLIDARRNKAGMLLAPQQGAMDRRIPESIDAPLQIKVLDKRGNFLYSDSTNIAGFELVGDFRKLEGMLK